MVNKYVRILQSQPNKDRPAIIVFITKQEKPLNKFKMLTVKTKIKEGSIAGIGLFADQFIPKGTLVWKFQKGFASVLFFGNEINFYS